MTRRTTMCHGRTFSVDQLAGPLARKLRPHIEKRARQLAAEEKAARRRRPPEWRVCVHEAGHAVAELTHGGVPGTVDGVNGTYYPGAGEMTLEGSVAGAVAAEMFAGGRGGFSRTDERNAEREAEKRSRRSNVLAGLQYHRLQARAAVQRLFVRTGYRDAVHALARVLMADGVVNGDRARQIVARHIDIETESHRNLRRAA